MELIAGFFLFLVTLLVLGVAPTPTNRTTPTGIKLKDGFPTKVTFAADPDVSIWEKSVKPPGIDGGDAIDQTTMHNEDWTTMAAQALKSLTDASFQFAYDPACYTQLNLLVNVETTITKTFKDGSQLAYYGYLRTVDFDELTRGEQPTGTATIQPTNWDPVNNVEAGPSITSVEGT